MSEELTIRTAMDGFLANLNSEHTQQAYATPLKHFATYLAGQGLHVDRSPATALTVDHAIGFAPWLRHSCFPEPDRPARATIQLYLTALYRFYRSLLKRGAAFEAADIARLEETYRDARNIRGEPRPKEPRLAAVQAIIHAARSVPPVSGDRPADHGRELARLRDIAIVETLRSTGCRVGELIALRRGDLDWLTHSALVKGKGSKYRKVYLDDVAWRALKTYLRAQQDGGDSRALVRLPVFCGHGNRSGSSPSPLTTRHVSRTIQDLAEKAGIAEAGITPHYFRHVFATRALERTENLALVQDMLGHASPATTRVYARTNEKQRREGYARVWDKDTVQEEFERTAGAFDQQRVGNGVGWSFDAFAPVLDAMHLRGHEPRAYDAGEWMGAAMVELLRVAGCSLYELVSLRLRDIDAERHSVRILSPAGSRTVYLDDRARSALSSYLQARPGNSSTGPLFCTADGPVLTVRDAYARVQEVAAQAGLDSADLHLLL